MKTLDMKVRITKNKVNNYLSEKQVSALCVAEDPLEAIIKSVVARVRVEVLSHEENSFPNGDNEVPQELELTTCHLVIEALQTRIPGLKLSPDQVRNADNARKFLSRIAAGEIVIQAQVSWDEDVKINYIMRRPRNKRNLTTNDLKGL